MPKKANRKKGSPKPIEKITNIIKPPATVSEVDANRRMDPKIGPIHGDHPRAIDDPSINELIGLPGLIDAGIGKLKFFLNLPNFNTSNMNKPKRMMTKPANLLKIIRNCPK